MHIGQNISVFEVRLEHTCIRMNWDLRTCISYLAASLRHKNVKSLRIQRHQCIQKQYYVIIQILYIKIGLVLSCCNYNTIIYTYVESSESKLSIAHQLS